MGEVVKFESPTYSARDVVEDLVKAKDHLARIGVVIEYKNGDQDTIWSSMPIEKLVFLGSMLEDDIKEYAFDTFEDGDPA